MMIDAETCKRVAYCAFGAGACFGLVAGVLIGTLLNIISPKGELTNGTDDRNVE